MLTKETVIPIRTFLAKPQDNLPDLYSRLIVVEFATGTGNPGGATIQQSTVGDVIGQDPNTYN